MNIYGHDIELEESNPGEIITDVMVIARTVHYGEDGKAIDTALISHTRQTGGMIQVGMLDFARDSMQELDD